MDRSSSGSSSRSSSDGSDSSGSSGSSGGWSSSSGSRCVRSGDESYDNDRSAAVSMAVESYDVGAIVAVASLYVSGSSAEDSGNESSTVESGDG